MKRLQVEKGLKFYVRKIISGRWTALRSFIIDSTVKNRKLQQGTQRSGEIMESWT